MIKWIMIFILSSYWGIRRIRLFCRDFFLTLIKISSNLNRVGLLSKRMMKNLIMWRKGRRLKGRRRVFFWFFIMEVE